MIINFADAYRLQKPDMGNVGGCRHNIESVYLRSFLALQKLRNFQNHSQECGNSRCLVDMYVIIMWHVEYRIVSYIIFSVRLLRCSFYYGGQCEGLR